MTEQPVERPQDQGAIIFNHDPDTTSAAKHHTWYRGPHTNRAPNQAAMLVPSAVADHVVQGWGPGAPAIDRSTKITAFGSCFAANISRWLGQRNYRVSSNDEEAQRAYVVQIGEGMVNSFVIRQQFEWAWEGKTFDQPLWHGYTAEAFGYDAEVQRETRALFDRTEVFILTFGLSEVWYDAPSGEVFWRTIPKDAYDPERHRFRISSVEENRENIDAIYRLIRKHRPDAKVIMTLSPVPLIATFRDNSCITSNSVSKAVLRVAVDEVMRAHGGDGHLFYWPSYEIVMDVFGGPFKADRRHLPRPVLDFIMIQFEDIWCHNEAQTDLPELDEAYLKALAAARIVPERLRRAVEKRRAEVLERHAEKDGLHEDPAVAYAMAHIMRSVAGRWRAEDQDRASGRS
ncbi:MAG: GSCFA domain-containing protein [Pseudomonadota bacterium]